jgi:hypothetical protein
VETVGQIQVCGHSWSWNLASEVGEQVSHHLGAMDQV